MRYARIIATAIFIASNLCVLRACAEEPKKGSAAVVIDENKYIKDTLPVENNYACQVGYTSACEVPVLLNSATKKVEYYWSAIKNGWVDAGDQRSALQTLYDDREEIRNQQRLKETQAEMDRRRRESMDYEMRNTPAHR